MVGFIILYKQQKHFNMNNLLRRFSIVFFIATIFISCEKEVGPLSDFKPVVPVTVSNATAFRPDPTVSTSISGGGAIQIVLNIPANSGRTIKEITKIAASTSYAAVQGIGTGIIYYTSAPIAGSGVSVTFTTSLTQYFTIHPVSPANPAAKADTELARRFYFLITLDDNSVIVSEPVRVLVLS
jgi:hypothetical protein